MLKAVLFDLDQTLLDWSQVESWEDYQRQRSTTPARSLTLRRI